VTANDLLKDVFANIVGNAIKHSAPGRPLTIGIRLADVKEGGISYYLVMIEDDGPGIPDERKATLFARTSTDRKAIARAGLGLGLSGRSPRTSEESLGRGPRAGTTGRGRFVVMLPAAGAEQRL
jgi:signal transduction histidine kinase